MSISYMLLWAFIIFIYGAGIGTAIKHKGKMKLRYLPFYIFPLPAKALVKVIALMPLVCSIIGMDYITREESGGKLDEAKTTLEIPISYFK